MYEKIFIEDMEITYRVVHRKIKNPRLEFKTGELVLILPENYHDHEKLIEKHLNWIYNKMDIIDKSKSCKLNYKRDEYALKCEISELVKYYSDKMGIIYGKISFRKMKKRWGSCDSEGNLKFNTRMKYLPEKLIQYVVFHEMSHLLEFGHNNNFWNIISQEYPDYKKLDYELSMFWFSIQEHTNNFKDP